MYRLAIIWIGKIILFVTKLRGGGSALPGLVVERLYPGFIDTMRPHFQKVVLISGTNGKTTTTKMLRRMLQGQDKTVVTNEAGSNMTRGVLAAALSGLDWQGRLQADVGLFEVDEGFAPMIAEALRPDVLVLLNLHRDQLDRYGELERTADLLAEAAKYAHAAVVNVDDGRLGLLAGELSVPVYSVGAVDKIRAQLPDDEALHGQVPAGTWHGAAAVVAASITPLQIKITEIHEINGRQTLEFQLERQDYQLQLPLLGVFNAYNATCALATAAALELDIARAAESLKNITPAFGRGERVEIGEAAVQLLLVKNPSGFNHIIRSYLSDASNNPVLIAINDNYADGRDVSWLWDVDIESLTGSRCTFNTSGSRGYDMALRLHYAEIASECELDLAAALDDFIAKLQPGQTGLVMPTYTALLEIRKLLGKYAKLEAWR